MNRRELLHTSLWGIMVLCLCAAVAMAAIRSPGWILAIGLLFWVALGAYLFGATELRKSLPWFAPLALLYYATFRLERWNGSTLLESYFGVFGTDTGRFLVLARRWIVEDRHAGFSLFLYLFHPAQAVGELLGMKRLGAEALFVESAVMGALAATLVFHWLRDQVLSLLPRLLVAYSFAFSMVAWVIATAIDTYVISLFLFLVFLVEAREYQAGRRRLPVLCGLVTSALLSISLENAYVPVLFLLCHLLFPRTGEGPWKGLAIYGATVIGAHAVLVAVLHVTAPTSRAQVSPPLLDFIGKFAAFDNLVSARVLLDVTQSETIAAVVAQEDLPASHYAVATWNPRPATVTYLGLMLALVALVVPVVRGGIRWRSWTPLLLGGTYALRHLFMMVWVPRESFVFTGPSIAVVALLIGCGASALQQAGSHRRLLWYGGALAVLDALLLLHNGHYVFTVQLPWR